jgi:hypothetical protein
VGVGLQAVSGVGNDHQIAVITVSAHGACNAAHGQLDGRVARDGIEHKKAGARSGAQASENVGHGGVSVGVAEGQRDGQDEECAASARRQSSEHLLCASVSQRGAGDGVAGS